MEAVGGVRGGPDASEGVVALHPEPPTEGARSTVVWSDERIVEGIIAGEPAAVEAFLDTYASLILGIVRKRVRHGSDVDDVVQDAGVAVWREISKGHLHGNSLRAYIAQITRNKCVDWHRAQKREIQTQSISEAGEGDLASHDDGERLADLAAMKSLVDEAVAALPRHEQEIISLVGDGVSYAEIALSQGRSERAIITQMSRLRRRLRDWIAIRAREIGLSDLMRPTVASAEEA